MYNEGTAPEFVFDQGMYYPTAANYGYYCTGFESPGEWEDQHKIFGLDGPEIQYAGAQNESLSYVYYTPSYGYAQSQYNPYNPYIHGAVMGPDSPFVGAQQYYAVPSYQSSVSSPTYAPILVPPDVLPNSSTDSLIDQSANRTPRNGRGLKSATSGGFSRNLSKPSSNHSSPLARVSGGPTSNIGLGKQSVTYGSLSPGGFPVPASSHIFQGRSNSASVQPADSVPNLNVHTEQLKVALPLNITFAELEPNADGRATIGKLVPKIHGSRTLEDANVGVDALSEQNRGPRINRSKTQVAVKAYTAKAGDSDAEGNIVIQTDRYNRDDFPVDYEDAKFFVIKSYSEDDVHKSIKYNVWSSTSHGNKKLNNAFEEAKNITAVKPSGCPIFLFFSVNASGQFCGVAEMIGPVDFNRDMDFWQQDKWSGSFAVKWHIIKDVPNSNLRHILLENNENKPVTNSRDTQEIMYKDGMEMLKIFKNHVLKTSILDDFIYYENRQKIMQEEKARLLFKRFERPFPVPALDHHSRQLNGIVELASGEKNKNKLNDSVSILKRNSAVTPEPVSFNSDVSNPTGAEESGEKMKTNATSDDAISTLKIGSLNISPKQFDPKLLLPPEHPKPTIDVVTVGSMPVKVNGFADPSGVLTFGTVALDPIALQQGAVARREVQNK